MPAGASERLHELSVRTNKNAPNVLYLTSERRCFPSALTAPSSNPVCWLRALWKMRVPGLRPQNPGGRPVWAVPHYRRVPVGAAPRNASRLKQTRKHYLPTSHRLENLRLGPHPRSPWDEPEKAPFSPSFRLWGKVYRTGIFNFSQANPAWKRSTAKVVCSQHSPRAEMHQRKPAQGSWGISGFPRRLEDTKPAINIGQGKHIPLAE